MKAIIVTHKAVTAGMRLVVRPAPAAQNDVLVLIDT
jgi:hypothetical protein